MNTGQVNLVDTVFSFQDRNFCQDLLKFSFEMPVFWRQRWNWNWTQLDTIAVGLGCLLLLLPMLCCSVRMLCNNINPPSKELLVARNVDLLNILPVGLLDKDHQEVDKELEEESDEVGNPSETTTTKDKKRDLDTVDGNNDDNLEDGSSEDDDTAEDSDSTEDENDDDENDDEDDSQEDEDSDDDDDDDNESKREVEENDSGELD